ncbi:response regulator [sulfur-oxidizing endosymbiont of Gigantopelta aegis]|uniref:response regulator transcription factor n=1 Tax=sulfur-oxidizing endosymbiont of Gigantopelta aegis TaxID=2794934 RepID=UPI0018DD2458|nr:response regulator [sulfur-oxidizing endosymbiont of Gigantopelta aegis]
MDDNNLTISDLIILIVEPSSVQAKIIQSRFQDAQVNSIQIAHNGAQAMALMADNPPDLVVSALYLPDMTGTELVQTMRNDSNMEKIPFMLISSETAFEQLDPIRQAGVVAILPKPFAFADLKRALFNTLDFINPSASDVEELDFNGFHVLVVDDSAMARKHIQRVLKKMGISSFQEAINGKEAIPLIENNFFDLIVTDYNMPEMDGGELTRYVREQSAQSSIPILMVTSENDNNRLAAVQQAGVSGICDKPFEPDTVKAYLKNIMADIDI